MQIKCLAESAHSCRRTSAALGGARAATTVINLVTVAAALMHTRKVFHYTHPTKEHQFMR